MPRLVSRLRIARRRAGARAAAHDRVLHAVGAAAAAARRAHALRRGDRRRHGHPDQPRRSRSSAPRASPSSTSRSGIGVIFVANSDGSFTSPPFPGNDGDYIDLSYDKNNETRRSLHHAPRRRAARRRRLPLTLVARCSQSGLARPGLALPEFVGGTPAAAPARGRGLRGARTSSTRISSPAPASPSRAARRASKPSTRRAASRPDLIIMDLGLPRMNGWEAIQLLKAGSADAPHPDHRADRPRAAALRRSGARGGRRHACCSSRARSTSCCAKSSGCCTPKRASRIRRIAGSDSGASAD